MECGKSPSARKKKKKNRLEFFLRFHSLSSPADKPFRAFAAVWTAGAQGEFEELSRSETIYKGLSLRFCTSFELEYEAAQAENTSLKVQLYKRKTECSERLRCHELISQCIVCVEDILCANGNHLQRKLTKLGADLMLGYMVLSAEEMDEDNIENESNVELDVCSIALRRRDWNKTTVSQRYELQRAHKHDDGDGNIVWLPIYESNRISKQKGGNQNVEFTRANMKLRHLCNGDDERALRIVVYGLAQTTVRTSVESYVGMVDFTLRDICELDPTQEVLVLEGVGDDQEDIGCVSILKAEPTDVGSHFSLKINHETSKRFSSVGCEEKGRFRTFRKKKIIFGRWRGATNRDGGCSKKKLLAELPLPMHLLFSSSRSVEEAE